MNNIEIKKTICLRVESPETSNSYPIYLEEIFKERFGGNLAVYPNCSGKEDLSITAKGKTLVNQEPPWLVIPKVLFLFIFPIYSEHARVFRFDIEELKTRKRLTLAKTYKFQFSTNLVSMHRRGKNINKRYRENDEDIAHLVLLEIKSNFYDAK